MRTLQQDRELEAQRQRERLEVAAGRVGLEIERKLQGIEAQLAIGDGVHFLATGIESSANVRVLFQPVITPTATETPASFAGAELEEFQRHNLPAAEAEYRRLAKTSETTVRAAALVGLGRVLRLQKDFEGALAAYADLARLGTVVVAGQPAGLAAHQGRCKTLEAAGDNERFRIEVRGLARALESGDWLIDRATFDLYRDLIEQWGGTPPPSDAIARTEALVELWHLWRRGDLGTRGRRILQRGPGAVLAVWVGDGDRLTTWLVTDSEIEATWLPSWDGKDLRLSLSDVEGRRFVGVPGDRSVSLTPSVTHLPFILNASLTRDEAPDRSSRRVLVIGLLLALTVTVAAAYALYRTTTRELALARQQADFVAAVSHEFRTPLTSMRHLTELLASRAVTSEERKAHYYALLAHETERLHRMVESLLSFGRMDVDAYSWQLEPAEVDRMVMGIVEELRRETLTE
jgi:hypothetical protein